ncbi:short-chain dehydrogenase/reductase family 16C member 6-like isoform X2 [Cataglyphis hispanica]|uniref:short-chain dehydrogenase/reductase family 16C member 6-like isoform X2 n=1 Tax=Cataglyphis hispanica TaxID=1086592 RepID=UPI00217F52A7|nr:short-chain dehydrogenase/reductase family 16C member 6-like isoform X2 [Cataglyphis hispanica]
MMNLKKAARMIYDLFLFIGAMIIYIIKTVISTLIPHRYRAKLIKDEIALVTGGASGIGKLIAIKLAKLGARVIIWDINKNGLMEVAEEIKKAGGKCYTYYCDIADKEEIYRIAKVVQIEVGNVSMLVNNAGYVYGRTFMELPDCEIEQTFKVNILSHYWMHGYDGIHMTLVCPYLINTGMFNGVNPRLMPMLKPEYVAERVVAGVLTNEMLIVLPNFIKYFLPFKYLLPIKICWALMYHILKGPQIMMTFKGRESRKTSDDNDSLIHYKHIYE